MQVPERLLPGESQNAPLFTSILLRGRATEEKKAAAYAKLHNRPEGQAVRKKRGAAKNRSAPRLNYKLSLAFGYRVRILAQEIQRRRFLRR
jgi:hypothetical protein